ncbi:MAG: hypothetical protein WCQ21_21130, partial [Verrucomicrobiota bacterium]
MRKAPLILAITALPMLAGAAEPLSSAPPHSPFELKLDAGTIVSLKAASDSNHTEYVRPGARLGDVSIRYRQPVYLRHHPVENGERGRV